MPYSGPTSLFIRVLLNKRVRCSLHRCAQPRSLALAPPHCADTKFARPVFASSASDRCAGTAFQLVPTRGAPTTSSLAPVVAGIHAALQDWVHARTDHQPPGDPRLPQTPADLQGDSTRAFECQRYERTHERRSGGTYQYFVSLCVWGTVLASTGSSDSMTV